VVSYEKVIRNCFLLLGTLTGVVAVVLICDFLSFKTALLGQPLFLGGSGSVSSVSDRPFIYLFIFLSL
jgi:hypothetical protein